MTSETREQWFELEVSEVGANDWYAVSGRNRTFDAITNAEAEIRRRQRVEKRKAQAPGTVRYEYRIVCKTLTTEAI